MSTREELIARYKTASTEKEKAEIEQLLWSGTTQDERRDIVRRLWLSKLLNIDQGTTQCRSSILALGTPGEVIWIRIDNKMMTLSTGSRLACAARELALTCKMPINEALTEVVADYDRLPLVAWVDGVQVRRKNPGSPVSKPASLQAAVPEVPAPAPQPRDAEKPFWESLRLQVVPFVASKLQGADPVTAEMLSLEFERDLKILLQDFQLRIYRAARTTKDHAKVALKTISRTKVRAACEALDMVPPETGRPADLKVALSQKWKLARAYHPDANGGLQTESTREKFKAALDAYECLVEYNASLSTGVGP